MGWGAPAEVAQPLQEEVLRQPCQWDLGGESGGRRARTAALAPKLTTLPALRPWLVPFVLMAVPACVGVRWSELSLPGLSPWVPPNPDGGLTHKTKSSVWAPRVLGCARGPAGGRGQSPWPCCCSRPRRPPTWGLGEGC